MTIFDDPTWQMTLGERAALCGLLVELEPSRSCVIGGIEAASATMLAKYSSELHIFGCANHARALPDSAIVHDNDYQAALATALTEFGATRRNVDLALVEGVHSSTVVREIVECLLESSAFLKAYILLRDATNEAVRHGLELVRYAAWSKVAFVDLDFVPGYMFSDEQLHNEIWGGLGLIVIDASRSSPGAAGAPASDNRRYPVSSLYVRARESLALADQSDRRLHRPTGDERTDNLMKEIALLENEVASVADLAAFHERLWRSMQDSVSWRITTPLRTLAARARR